MTALRPILQVEGVISDYGRTRVLHGIDLALAPAETLGLVGESGSGKSTLARAIAGLRPVSGGRILIDGLDRNILSRRERLRQQARVQMVFQDPASSLNPRVRIGDALREPLIVHQRGSRAEQAAQVALMLARVGLGPDAALRFPADFSGGQRQRISLARALILSPDLIICDEAVSALDVSVRAQILNLLLDLRREFQPAFLFISHDLAVVRHVADRVAVLYRGRLVEIAPTRAFWDAPLHPYSQALLNAAIHHSPARGIPGDDTPPLSTGCPFIDRCPQRTDACLAEEPRLRRIGAHRQVACHVVWQHWDR